MKPLPPYFIVSLKHTDSKDKYLTLWRPDNRGYCYPLELAGKYLTFKPGYHYDNEGNIPVPVDLLTKFIVKDDLGRDCFKRSKMSVSCVREFGHTLLHSLTMPQV